MMRTILRCMGIVAGTFVLLASSGMAEAASSIKIPGMEISVGGGASGASSLGTAMQILLGLTVLSLAPAILISVTSFVRIIVVLSMLRHAFGMQETPPNTILVSLALFLTLFTMMPVLEQVNTQALKPLIANKLSAEEAYTAGIAPIRDFMIRQTREQDLALMVEISGKPLPRTVEEVSLVHLIPGFMLSELRTAFQIGFVVFLPFLLIDLVVSTILMSLGMMMVPPVMISLPIKILMFVLIDGWNLVVHSLIASFY